MLIPPPADRAEVHRIIYDELCLGVFKEHSRAIYRGVIERLVDAGAQGVILGCTEIELLISARDCSVPVFPTTRIHVASRCRLVAGEIVARESLSTPLDPDIV